MLRKIIYRVTKNADLKLCEQLSLIRLTMICGGVEKIVH